MQTFPLIRLSRIWPNLRIRFNPHEHNIEKSGAWSSPFPHLFPTPYLVPPSSYDLPLPSMSFLLFPSFSYSLVWVFMLSLPRPTQPLVIIYHSILSSNLLPPNLPPLSLLSPLIPDHTRLFFFFLLSFLVCSLPTPIHPYLPLLSSSDSLPLNLLHFPSFKILYSSSGEPQTTLPQPCPQCTVPVHDLAPTPSATATTVQTASHSGKPSATNLRVHISEGTKSLEDQPPPATLINLTVWV